MSRTYHSPWERSEVYQRRTRARDREIQAARHGLAWALLFAAIFAYFVLRAWPWRTP